jgi:hypothetical protein
VDGWTTLQLHLKKANQAREAGDLERALEHVDAALAIDPEFIAARMLRESLVPAGVAPAPANPPPAIERPDVVSADTYASIEARARRRRIDQRLGVTRAGIAAGHFGEAAAALEELATLDPTLPEIPALAAQLESKRIAARRRRALVSGVVVVAASAAVGVGLGLIVARWPVLNTPPATPVEKQLSRVEEPATASQAAAPDVQVRTDTQPATTIPGATAPVAPGGQAAAAPPIEQPAAADQERSADARRAIDSAPDVARDARIAPPPPAPSGETRRVEEAPPAPAVPAPPVSQTSPASQAPANSVATAARTVPPPVPEPAAPAPATPATATAAPPFPVDDAALIRETLQRYRRAYNGLDARLAHAVYPGVDEAALAHAFDGLHSQSLEFDSCILDTQEGSARAVCRGSARYVPKVGSRAPRAEPRVWTFRLNKDDGDWKITSAWTDR